MLTEMTLALPFRDDDAIVDDTTTDDPDTDLL
jgi:hypothetical protein